MRRLLGFLVVLVVLVGAVVVADVWARGRVEDRIVAEVQGAVPGLVDVTADVRGTPVLTQLAARRLADVRVTATSARLEGITLEDVAARATGVTTEAPVTAEHLELSGLVPLASISEALGLDADLTVESGAVVVTLRSLPVTARVVPEAAGTAVALRVEELGLAGVAVAPEDLPLGLGDGLADLAVPIEGLPTGLEVTDATVAPDGVRLTAAGDGVPIQQP